MRTTPVERWDNTTITRRRHAISGAKLAPVLAFIPILELYASPLSGLSLGRMVAILLIVMALFGNHRYSLGLPVAPLVLAVALTAISLIAVIITAPTGNVIQDLLARLLIVATWALAIASITPTMIDHHKIARWVVAIATLATAYLAVQTAYWRLTGQPLPSLLNLPPYIQPATLGYADLSTLAEHYDAFYYRPPSFFGEPQYYSDYASLALIITLFHPAIRARTQFSLILSLGLIISTSATAIAIGGLIWMYFIFSKRRYLRINAATLLGASVAGFGGTSLLFYAPTQMQLSKTLEKLTGVLDNSRVGGSFRLLADHEGIQVMIGQGMGLETSPGYINTVTAVLLGTGLLGGICLATYFFYILSRTRNGPRLILLAYVCLSLTGSMLYSDRSLLWLSLAFTWALSRKGSGTSGAGPLQHVATHRYK